MRPQPRKYTEEALAAPEVQPRPRGQPQKVIPEQETLGETEMQPTRKDLVDARAHFEDDRWLQKQKDSDSLSLVQACDEGPSTRDRPVFYKAMFDETTLEIRYCVVCGLQSLPRLYVGRLLWPVRTGRASFAS